MHNIIIKHNLINKHKQIHWKHFKNNFYRKQEMLINVNVPSKKLELQIKPLFPTWQSHVS